MSRFTMPESLAIAPIPEQSPNYRAFKDDGFISRLFNEEVLENLKDVGSVENRKTALKEIHQTIQDCKPELLNENLQTLVVLLMISLGDVNIKIVSTTLQALQDLVDKVKVNISGHLNQMLSTYLEKITCNKYNVKQAGVKFLIHLMGVVDPMKVLDVVMEHGAQSRRSKLREETLNIITITLLRFPKHSFNLETIVEKATPLLADNKQTVRQSCLEMCAVLTQHLGKDRLNKLVSAVSSLDQTTRDFAPQSAGGPSLMRAFEKRLARNVLPSINDDGLLAPEINVANGKGSSEGVTGPDVDWILAGATGKSSSPSTGGRKMSMSGSGPLRSAGKKLPWDSKEKPNKVLQPSQPAPTYSSMFQQQSFPRQIHVPPLVLSTTLPKQGKGYLDLYQDRSSIRATSEKQSFQQHSTRHSVARGVAKDQPVVSNGLNDSMGGDIDQFAITWPRSNGYHSSFAKSTSRQTSADSNVTLPALTQSRNGNGTLPALVTTSRPPSKPIVRNLFPPHSQPTPNPAVEKTLLSHPPLTTPTNAHSTSAQIEKSFLSGSGGSHNEEDTDRDYYNIPIDDGMLNSSLSSSVTSLYGNKDGQLLLSAHKKNTSDQMTSSRPTQNHSKVDTAATTTGTWNVESVQPSASTSPVNTPPLKHGPSPQKMSSRNTNRSNLKRNNSLPSKKSNASSSQARPTDVSYSKKYTDTLQSTVGGEEGVVTPIEEEIIETTLNKTFTISPKERATANATKSMKSPPRIASVPGTTTSTVERTKNKYNSYAEASAMRKGGTKLLSSPNHNPLTTTAYSIELDVTHTPSMKSTPVKQESGHPGINTRKPPKKTSPPKQLVSTPLRGTRQSLSPISTTSNSAPVYRVAPTDTSFEQDSLADILPHPNPEQAIKDLFEDLATGPEEWERKRDGLLTIRRLVAFNEETIIPHLQRIIHLVIGEVKSPRSQVSRSAIACLGDMFAFVGREMEQQLDNIVKTILQVGAKANVFYREDVEKVIFEMIGKVTLNKCIVSLLNGGLRHGSTTVRRLLSHSLFVMVEQHGAELVLKQPSRDVLEKLLNAFAMLLADADAGARYHAKQAINELYGHPEFERTVNKLLNNKQSVKVKETIESLKTKGLGKPPPELNPAKSTRQSTNVNRSLTAPSTGPSPLMRQEYCGPKLRKRRVSDNGLNDTPTASSSSGNIEVTAPLPDGLLAKMGGNDWNERNKAITQLETFITEHSTELGTNVVKIFDVFNQRLTDQNSKVNLHALESFQRFVPLIGSQLQPVLSPLIESLVRTVASRYPTIHSAAIRAMETLIASMEPYLLLSPLASAAINGNARVQPFMLRKLADLLPSVHQQRPAQVQRIALPVLWKVLSLRSPATGEAKAALQFLSHSLHSCLGPERLDAAMAQQPSDIQQRLRDILKS